MRPGPRASITTTAPCAAPSWRGPEQLGLPVTEENVQIARRAGYITIDVRYTVPVEFPGYIVPLELPPRHREPHFLRCFIVLTIKVRDNGPLVVDGESILLRRRRQRIPS